MSVLVIIEPHKEYRTILKILFKRQNWGVNVFEASNNKDGLKVIKLENPDIVFVDIKLRNNSEQKLEVSIKDIAPSCRVIILTPFESKTFNRWHKTDDIDAFISKDELSESFVPMMKKYLNV